MASLMDMRELGMLRNAAQRMESGGGIVMDEWRRRKVAEEQSAAEQAIAAAQADPIYQALMSGAVGGPAAVGSVGNVVKSLPFLRHADPIVRGAKSAAEKAKRVLWKPGTKPHIQASGKTVPGTPGRPSGVALTAIEAAALGGGGYVADRIFNPRGMSKEASPDIAPGITQARVGPSTDGTIITEEPSPSGIFSPEVLAKATAGVGAQVGIPARQHEGMPTKAFVPKVMPQGEKEKEELVIEDTNTSVETPDNKPNLWKTWGSLADNPKERKKAYLSSIKNIYMKKMLLDSIAKLTGGKSQGGAWAQMAIAELDAIEKFDSEERTHNQWKALFFREDGTYDPPKNRKEAMERGGKLGYSPAQMKDILSIFPKKEDKRTNLEKTLEFIESLPKGSARRIALEKKYIGMHEEEDDDRSAYEKLLDKAVKQGWITDEERNRSVKSKLGLDVDVKSATALQRNIETALAAGAITPEQANEARRYALLGGKQGSDKGFSARSQMIGLYLRDKRVMGAAGKTIKENAPSFTAWLAEPSNAATLNSLLGGAVLGGSDVIDLGEI